jgi:uncharacterized protein YdgA (DUF945 family)
MHKLAVAAALLALVLLAVPRVVASVTEARVRERVAVIDASDGVAAEVAAYARGWFRSEARIVLRFSGDNVSLDAAQSNTLEQVPIPLAVRLAHGPVAVLDGVHLGWSKMIARLDTATPGVAELEQTLGVPYVFEFRGQTAFSGLMTFDADAPAFDLPLDETLITFSGGNVAGTFAGRRLVARAEVAGLEVVSPTGTFALHDVRADADNELRSQYLLPGRASLAIERIAVTDALRRTGSVFEAAAVRIASVSELDAAGELLDAHVDYTIDSLSLEAGEVTDANLGMALRNVDVAALEAYRAAAGDAAATTTDSGAIVRALGPELERALRAGPSLVLDPIHFRFDDEPFDARVELTTNTARLPAAGALNLDNPLLVLGVVNAVAELRTPKTLAQRLATLATKMQLGGDGSLPPDELDYLAQAQSALVLSLLIAENVLIEDGDAYRSTLELTDGNIVINGNPAPFALP